MSAVLTDSQIQALLVRSSRTRRPIAVDSKISGRSTNHFGGRSIKELMLVGRAISGFDLPE